MKFRRQLFKYLDVTGALAMLSKGTLQFTNSFYFNDPFDCHPSLVDFSSDPDRITDKIAKVHKISTLAIFLYDSCPPYVPQRK